MSDFDKDAPTEIWLRATAEKIKQHGQFANYNGTVHMKLNSIADELDSLRKQLAAAEKRATHNYKQLVETQTLLAESQVRVKELEEALKKAVETTYSDSLFETWNKILSNKSPSSALDRAIRQAKVEALEDAAKWFDDQEFVDMTPSGIAGYAENELRRMADELRKEL